MNQSKEIKAAVIGGGLTGLTTAFYLKKAGINAHIYEKSDRVGGVIHTYNKSGFTFEAGPNSGVLSRVEAAELLEDLQDECTLKEANQASKARWIWKNKKWEPLPSGLMGGVTTPLFTFSDKLRILGEPFRSRGKNPDETLAELVLRRMGKSFLDYAIDPFILGIYSGDPGKLVTKYAFSKLYELEQNYGSFIGGSIKKAREPKTARDKKITRAIFSIEGGLQNLINALEKKIGMENIHLNCKNLSIEKNGNLYTTNQNKEEYSYVISTTGAYALPSLFPFLPGEQIKSITQMKYSRVVQVALGFNAWEGMPLKAFGGLVPSIEKRDVLGILFLSSCFKNKAPEKGALLSIFLGGVRHPEMADLNDDEITNIVRREVSEMMQLDKFKPDLMKIFRYKHAIPQYGLESKEKLKAIKQIEKQFPGLILAGNIRDGIGIADRIKQGRIIAEELIKGDYE